jgi:hypothetical protein
MSLRCFPRNLPETMKVYRKAALNNSKGILAQVIEEQKNT